MSDYLHTIEQSRRFLFHVPLNMQNFLPAPWTGYDETAFTNENAGASNADIALSPASGNGFNKRYLVSNLTTDKPTNAYPLPREFKRVMPGMGITIAGWFQVVNVTTTTVDAAITYYSDVEHQNVLTGSVMNLPNTAWNFFSKTFTVPDGAVLIDPIKIRLRNTTNGDSIAFGPLYVAITDPPIFTWTPSWTPQLTPKPRVLKAHFGDGYTQRAKDGLNNVRRALNVNFDARGEDEASAIDDFLRVCGGATAFMFTDFNGKPGMWTCENWTVSRTSPQLYKVQATFEEDFTPRDYELFTP